METSNNSNNITQPTSCLKMRELIEVINEYKKTRTDSGALLINKFLQAYSVTIDVSVFEPDSSLGAQLYVKLYELFSIVEPQSQVAWNLVDVLCNACRNSSAKKALIDTFQFVPLISRMLEDQLSNLNKKKLLLLLQDLTCGIKLSWQISHLPHLMKTLSKWVGDRDYDIVCLSLSVLVNLCYKNLPACYTLSKIVNIKKFLRFCLPLKGSLLESHVCKLVIIFDQLDDDDIPRKDLVNLVKPTIRSMEESLSKNDPVMLRSTVDFFVEVVNNENAEIFGKYGFYIQHLDTLIQQINSRKSTDPDATPLPQYDPECVSQVLKFIYTLEINKVANLSKLYHKILKLALDWVISEKVSYQAYLLLCTLTQNLSESDENKCVLNLFVSKLPTLLTSLQRESTPGNMDGCKRLGSLLQLLRVMLKSSFISGEVLNGLKEQVVMGIFSPILSDDLNFGNLLQLKINEESTTTTAYVDAYVHAVCLVYEIAQHDARWLDLLTTLMESRNVQYLLAMALSGSNSNVKQLVLELSKSSRFPIAKVAESMESKQNMFCTTKYVNNSQCMMPLINPSFPILDYGQIDKFDKLLENFQRLVEQQDNTEISISQVMELYEYKLLSMSQSELSAANGLKAASDRCVNLQHRLAQLSAEHNKYGQLIHHYEKKIEKTNKAMTDLKIHCKDIEKKFNGDIRKKEAQILEIENRLKDATNELTETTAQKHSLEEQLTKSEKLITKLEENANKLEKKFETREHQLNNLNSHIDGLNLQIKELRKMLDQKEAKLADVTKHYLSTKEVLDTITKMATSQNAFKPE